MGVLWAATGGLFLVVFGILYWVSSATRGNVVPAPEPRATPPGLAAPAGVPPAGAPAAPAPAPPLPAGEKGGTGRVVVYPQEGFRALYWRPRDDESHPHTPIEVEFSDPVNRRSVEAGLQVEPPVKGTFVWKSPAHVLLRPAEALPYGAKVQVRLREGITDETGTKRLPPYEWSYTTLSEYRYARQVARFIRAGCGSCHGSSGPARLVPLDSYQEVMKHVVPGQARASRLVAALDEAKLHGGVRPEVREHLRILSEWIERFRAAE